MLLSKLCFYSGLISIPISIAFWFLAPEFGADTFRGIQDEGVRLALATAHAERWGIFVGLWPATLLILSRILDTKGK
jgi:hypothetical protein